MDTQDGERASILERWLLLAALGFYALAVPLCFALLRPGFAAYDEESLIDQVQAWREGHPLIVRFAWSSLFRGADILLTWAAGPHLFTLHLVALAAVLAEAVLLFVWLRTPLGERAALWAVLADLVCTATFARGASLLGDSLLPAALLAGVLACERLRRPWQASLWGLAVALMLLDYEGWGAALLFLAPYGLWRWRRDTARAFAAAAGLAAGAAVVLALSPDLAGHIRSRAAISLPHAGYAAHVWTNLRGLLTRGDRMAFSAAAYHPWPPPWIWPLAPLGAAGVWRRMPWLAWLMLCASLPLALAGTCFEPHRLSLALLVLAACAGMGVARLWQRPWGRALCLALLVWGSADEIAAWRAEPTAKLALVYGDSLKLERAADWLALHRPAGGWRVITGLGPRNDGAFRFLLAQDGVPQGGTIPVALVPWDYLPGLRGLRGPFPPIRFGNARPWTLVFPDAGGAARLEAVSRLVSGIHWTQISQSMGVLNRTTLAWLKAPGHGDPWARTVVWELWLFSSLERRSLDMVDLRTLLDEPLVCGWGPDVLARELASAHPRMALAFRRKAEAVDPRRKGMAPLDRTARY